MIERTSTGLPKLGMGDATAGLTQTQAGATALTKAVNRVTTGNANDGVALTRGDYANDVDGTIIVTNLSAVALKVYPFYDANTAAGDGSTIDGGSANAAITHAASTTRIYTLTALKTWKSALLS
jgi:hypothetical protein